MIEFRNVNKYFGDKFHVLKNINLNIEEGGIFVLIGPSGSGKTTILKSINALHKIKNGDIIINGKSIKDFNKINLRRNIGYVLQRDSLLPHMTIRENVGIVLKIRGIKEENYKEKVNSLLKKVNLNPDIYAERYPHQLSGGQRQRVGIARALASDSDIILMDEPFSALDPITREQLQDELIWLESELNKTIVFVTHDIDEAFKIGNKIAVLNKGEIIQVGTPEEIINQPENEFVISFIGEKRIKKLKEIKQKRKLENILSENPNILLEEAMNIIRGEK